MTDTITVLSLGAGVQSTTLLLMACHGEIDPLPVEAIFADTGWEPAAVYRHLEWLESVSTIPIVRVSAGNIRDAALSRDFVAMPLYLSGDDDSKQMLRRQCTREFKVAPIRKHIRATHGRVRLLMGISRDEATRMKPSDVQYIENVYPLVDRMMTRHDCLRWLERNGYPRPPKSACIGCPFHDNAYWRDMNRNQPVEWADAVAFDESIRSLSRVSGQAFIHRQMIPLRDVDMRTAQDRGQLAFDLECEGMCGV